ncbi:prolipoprotein diacylglyceryl transferase [Candidatus Latescibacterota bacterium]
MHPTIISIGPFAIRSYGLLLAIGFFLGILLAAKRARKIGENPDHIYNLSVWVVLSSLIGARLYYIASFYHEFRADDAETLTARIFTEMKNMFWPVGSDGQVGISGLVLYGGLIFATITATVYFKRNRLNIPLYMDIIAPSIGLGEFFTRIGCFLNGCCFGKPTDFFLSVVFPRESAAGYYFPDMHIHPTQLYNSLAGLSIVVILLSLERFKKFNGHTALLYFILYSIGRFTIDNYRYYSNSLTWGEFSHNQVYSMIVIVIAGSLFAWLHIRALKKAV